jgi:predicted nucleic acid-binding protein
VIIVSDASPIICLSAVDHLDLLRQLYGQVWIPESVREEISRPGSHQPGVAELQAASWILSKSARNEVLVRALEGELDQGEAEAIALAVELEAELLLIDERRGRKVASRLGVRPIGTLGVLIEAKQKDLIPEVGPILKDLQEKAGFRISIQLHEHVLAVAGESRR